ncbi:MAG: hypothetical protein H0W99_00510 [Acidobacteria bacterium]|nr:hypothetical protein [Acidobacteriota bacterium]
MSDFAERKAAEVSIRFQAHLLSGPDRNKPKGGARLRHDDGDAAAQFALG